MTEFAPPMTFDVMAKRIDSEARCKSAVIALDTDVGGNAQAFNLADLLPAELWHASPGAAAR